MTALDGGKEAAVLLGVDFEKAFNRMKHSVCLDQVSTLKERQLKRCDGFIKKVVANPRFGAAWLPPRPDTSRDLSVRREIQETQATSVRRFNSPLSFLRRRANQIGIIPEVWASKG